MARARQLRAFGVIGGMGPESTALFYRLVVREMQERFDAYLDEDFPEMLIHSLPIPDITRGAHEREAVLARAAGSVRLLSGAGVAFVVTTCNSLDFVLSDLRASSPVPLLSIVEETARAVRASGAASVLLLATPTTLEERLYERHLGEVRAIRPAAQGSVTALILDALRGRPDSAGLRALVDRERGRADLVVLGCTDLSLLAEGWRDEGVVDSLCAMARAAVDRSVSGGA